MPVFDEPHHDGSSLYLPVRDFSLGDLVPVRVRVPRTCPYEAVWLRSIKDGDIAISRCEVVEENDIERWYEGRVELHNPVTNYRFGLERPGGREFDWLNGTGTWRYEVPDAFDFRITSFGRAPAWIADGVIYQIFPDRFARSAAAGQRTPPDWAKPTEWGVEPAVRGHVTGQQFYGGDLAGIEEHLDELQRLGVDTLYLTPFFPSRSAHRYDATTFDEVDPALGGNGSLASLAGAVHARGMRIVGDLTTNHTGRSHEWFERAERGDRPPEADYYLWHSYPDDPVTWLGVWALPKLNWASAGLRRAFIEGPDSVAGKWLRAPYALDGWRIDVANMTGRYGEQDLAGDVARTIRHTVTAVNPQAALVAEHMHDPTDDLTGAGWQSAMNYAAFTRPVWNWLCDPDNEINYLGLPTRVPRRGGRDVVRAMREFAAQVPWQVSSVQWNNLGSHDTVRLRTLVGSPGRAQVAVALLMTYLGAPMMYAGDEWGLTGTTGEHGRVSMPWDEPERREASMWDVFHDLIALRRSESALRSGSLRWVLADDDAIGYVREDAEGALLIVAARAAWSGVRLPRLVPGAPAPETLHGGADLALADGGYLVPAATGPRASIWRLR